MSSPSPSSTYSSPSDNGVDLASARPARWIVMIARGGFRPFLKHSSLQSKRLYYKCADSNCPGKKYMQQVDDDQVLITYYEKHSCPNRTVFDTDSGSGTRPSIVEDAHSLELQEGQQQHKEKVSSEPNGEGLINNQQSIQVLEMPSVGISEEIQQEDYHDSFIDGISIEQLYAELMNKTQQEQRISFP